MDAVEELSVLFPDRDVTVRDPDTGAEVSLTVREFRFREGLEATALARPLLAALAALVPADRDGTDGEEEGVGRAHDRRRARRPCGALARTRRLRVRPGRGLAGPPERRGWACTLGGDVDGEPRLFFAPRRGPGGDADEGAGGEPVALSRVLDTLVRAGHGCGHLDLCERLTWRQIVLFYRAATEPALGD